MRKKFVFMLLTGVIAVLFSACGQVSGTDKSDITASVPEETRQDETIPVKENKTDSVTKIP